MSNPLITTDPFLFFYVTPHARWAASERGTLSYISDSVFIARSPLFQKYFKLARTRLPVWKETHHLMVLFSPLTFVSPVAVSRVKSRVIKRRLAIGWPITAGHLGIHGPRTAAPALPLSFIHATEAHSF